MIVATAGHIDHGKTLLVKTLTGVDTDRLPEEKARGISIDLGFAYLPLPSGELIGFVDVPGHERFVRNMLAGVCGIDYALLVVAADDGVMPQTLEHLNILNLLHIQRGAAVITKIDRVDEARVKEVADNVSALLSTTQLSGATVMPVSAVSGLGMNDLRELLKREAASSSSRASADQHFRYAADRAFTVAGSGTVVTGTVFNGKVAPGDKLVISPAGNEVRVRGIQIQGKPAQLASAGQRCALNLTGTDLEAVSRGDWVLAPPIHRPTQRIAGRVSVLASETQSLKHWTPVHLHLATADVTARIAIRRGESIAPGASAIVQLQLDKPVGALHGDRFILRDQSATRTLGGGVVLDPFVATASTKGRSKEARAAEFAALEQATPEATLDALIKLGRPVDLQRFETLFNMPFAQAVLLYDKANLIQLGKETRVGIPRARHQQILDAVVPHLETFHKTQPQAAGEETEILRKKLAAELSADDFGTLLRALADAHKIETSGSIARLPAHSTTANTADEKMWQLVKPALDTAGFNAPQIKDLALQLKLKEAIVKDFLYRKAKSNEIYRVTPDRFYTKATLAKLAATAQATAQAQPTGIFTAAQYRDWTGVGRGLAIEILEFMDTLGVTQRIGDTRKMRKDFVPILGEADVPAKPLLAAPRPAQLAPSSNKPANQQRRFNNNYRR
ncbi:MAG: selenocysteine-specific translation elongation factor [Burkholderiales bacterium]